jgi:hypothetical protein
VAGHFIHWAITAHVIAYNLGHLFQIDMEAGNSSTNNEAICLELLGVLRRCFMQQADVRLRLYGGELFVIIIIIIMKFSRC